MSFDVKNTLDTSGLMCPEPVMMLHSAIRDVEADDIIKLIATDPSTLRDVPKFCDFLGHQLLQQEESDACYLYYIQKS